jgi:4-amino-4-deoxy-L-arabinose transferase-like glycosyltransferase
MDDASDLIERLSKGWRAYALIALISLLATLPGLVSLPVTDRDEARFAQATRQMLETGDFMRINVQDVPRHKKPIGIHWMQAASVAATQPITGDFNTIWAYRLPSVLGAMIAALAAFWGGSATVCRRAALIGACLLAPTLLLSTEGFIAKTDAMLAGVTTFAMATLARLRQRGTGGRGLALAFWAAIGVGALLKGPVTPMAAGLALLALALWERRARWMVPLAWWPGPSIALLISAPWLIAIQIATNGAFLRDAFLGDLAPKLVSGHEGHSGPPGFHLVALAATFFPATIGLIPGAMLAWGALRAPASDGAQAGLRFLIAWAVPTWAVFELLPTKLAHYMLPTFPALALLAGAGLVAAEERKWRASPIFSILLFAVGAAFLVAVNVYAATFMPGDAQAGGRRALQTALLGGTGALILLAAILFAKRSAARVAFAVVLAVAGLWSLRERILPEARIWFISSEIAAALRRNGLSEAPLTVLGYRETSLAFETRTDIRLLPEQDWPGAADTVSAGEAAVVSCSRSENFGAELRRRGFDLEVVAQVRGRNYGNGDDVCLNVGQITAPAR